jgi:hypothetical protein
MRETSNEQISREIKGALNEVDLPETDEAEELAFYRRYREMGGIAIEEFEERLRNFERVDRSKPDEGEEVPQAD